MKPTNKNLPRHFDYSLNFKEINFRKRPKLYRVGVGEQGVLLVEPYKSELLPLWRFRTPQVARKSAAAILSKLSVYKKEKDFIGMDMARKFLQMGYTRSRRYANHRTGKKYKGPVPQSKKRQSGAHGRPILPRDFDSLKAKSAAIFLKAWKKVEHDPLYRELKKEWKLLYG